MSIGKDGLLRRALGIKTLLRITVVPGDLIIDDATVLHLVEPSEIRLLHFLAVAHVGEFMAEETDGQLSLAKAARSFQDKET